MHHEVKPLTKAETNWICRLQKVLLACPSKRLALMTIGDANLTVIDDAVAKKYDLDLHDGRADENGLVLSVIESAIPIHGVSG